ncbi:hypothetical protein F4815DRAFT_482627 [Daldinia loculata]|nr:hypothetical protein F4815DRAFT_482627 [Daldinia loculata]
MGCLDWTKRRASKACFGCAGRKVRCDVLAVRFPCTNCRSASFKCSMKDRNAAGNTTLNKSIL